MVGSSHDNGVAGLRCTRCHTVYPADIAIDSKGCPACRAEAPANFEVVYTEAALAARRWPAPGHGIERFAGFLPVAAADMASLGEGDTPLLPASRLGDRLGLTKLYLKDESRNPTLSYKDRLSVIAAGLAHGRGATTLATASSGNAGASLAAYAARAGLSCLVATSPGATGPMLAQIRTSGATVLMMPTAGDRWPLLAEGVAQQGWFATSPYARPVVGSHPLCIEGYKTIAYEIVEQLDGDVPDWMVLPVCYGDALAGVWRGFLDLKHLGVIDRLPRMVAAEAYGSLSRTLQSGSDALVDVAANHQSIANSIGATQGAFQALNVLRQSNGTAHAPDNDAIMHWHGTLAHSEGLFVELTAAATIATIDHLVSKGTIKPSDQVVALLTASGLKDYGVSSADLPAIETFRGASADAQRILSTPK